MNVRIKKNSVKSMVYSVQCKKKEKKKKEIDVNACVILRGVRIRNTYNDKLNVS